MADGPALPEVALLEPPAIVAGVGSAVAVRLSAAPPADPPSCLAIFDNGQPLARTPLAAQGGAVVRAQIEAAMPSIMDICVCSDDGTQTGPKALLLALPAPVCDEVRGLFQGSVDSVRDGDAHRRARLLGLPEAQMRALDAGDLEARIRQAVWKGNFQELSKDMAAFLRHLWSRRGVGLPADATSDLHRLLQFLVKNKSWETMSFLLRACLEGGVPVAVCGSVLSEQDMRPGSLQAMAERLWQAFGLNGPGEE